MHRSHTTWLVTPELTWLPTHAVTTPEGTLTSIVSLLYRIAEQLRRINATEGLVLLDRAAAAQLGLDVEPVDGRHRALDYAGAQGWRHSALAPITAFFAKGRPTVYVGQLARLDDAGADFWPWGRHRWPGDVVAALNHWQRLSTVAWQAGPAVMGIELMHRHLPAYRIQDSAGKWRQAKPEKRCEASPPEASEPAWSPAMWGRPQLARCQHLLDRRRAGLTAAGAAKLAGPKLTRGWRRYDGTRAGWWLFSLPAWNDARMPHPCGPGKLYERVWRTTATLDLAAELAAQGLIDMPEIIDSLTGPARPLLLPWQQAIEGVYAAPAEDGYDPDDMRPIIQDVAQEVARRGIGMLAKGDGQSTIYRRDWHAAINATKRANGWRKAWKVGLSTGLWPIAVDDDGWWYASDEQDPHKIFPPNSFDLTNDVPGAYRAKRTREMAQ